MAEFDGLIINNAIVPIHTTDNAKFKGKNVVINNDIIHLNLQKFLFSSEVDKFSDDFEIKFEKKPKQFWRSVGKTVTTETIKSIYSWAISKGLDEYFHI